MNARAWRLVITCVLLTCPALAQNRPYVVVVAVANMYAQPSDRSSVVSQAIYGSNVVLLSARAEWSRIQTEDKYKGWTPSRYLRIVQSGGGYATSGSTIQVNSIFANLYREPDVTKHRPLITIPFETRLEVADEGKGKDEGWLQVRLPDKQTAWIQAADGISEVEPLSIAESIDLAKRFLGLPYLWGGRSSFGFDCSGFTQMIVRSRGVNMPRDADQQAAWNGAVPIQRKDLQPGDLLFFGADAKHIDHTGMFIGDGKFIDATTHGSPVIQIDNLEDDPWTKLLVACRRVK
ncbi:MAG TPA: SH3 domain-containing C40 family peptidase [Candidatus Sulfotelmatobacter sp.]|nr:SH3 domain-containing C40 family peptidase [Candidatus Sulfotelmatobacter sp.]